MEKHTKQKGEDACCSTSRSPIEMITENAGLPEDSLITTSFDVSGMDCGDEITAIQSALRGQGIARVETNLMAGTVIVSHLPSIVPSILKSKIESAGVKVKDSEKGEDHVIDKKRVTLVAISGVLVGVGLVGDFWFKNQTVSNVIFSLAVLSGGVLVFPKAFRSLRHLRLDMNVLMTVAVIGAFFIGQHSEAATVVFLFSLSELLESFSVARARKAVREVLDLTPNTALRLEPNGKTNEIPVNDVRVNDLILVKTGDRIPMDGTVEKGTSSVNQAPLTGESIPIEKKTGDQVFAGTINETGILEIKVLRPFRDSKVSQIIRMIEDAQKQKAPSQRFVDTFAKYYTPAIFVIALLILFIPPIFFHEAWNPWVYRALVLLVIACPCALVISTPVSIVSGLTAMARRGVLIKGGVFLETLGKIKAIAVDKTGTITKGKPTVQGFRALQDIAESDLLQIAASIEKLSSHPLAQAVVEFAERKDVVLKPATDFTTIVGRGAEARIEGHFYFLGNHRFAHELGVCTPDLESLLSKLEEAALSVIVVGHKPHENCQGEVLGVLSVGDTVRDNAVRAIKRLHEVGVQKVIMLSGDNQKTVSAIAKRATIDIALGDLLPDDKVREVKKLVSIYGTVAMIGDGINDAPALAESSLGIAMGAAGSDTAIETADVALMKDDLEEVAAAIEQGRRALGIIKFNIGIALAIKAVFLVLAFFGLTNLWLAVAADTGTSLLVIASALRLLNISPRPSIEEPSNGL